MVIVSLLCRWRNKGCPWALQTILEPSECPSRGTVAAESFRWACWSLKPTPSAAAPLYRRAPIPAAPVSEIGPLEATHLRPSCPRQRLVGSPRKQSFASDFCSCWWTGSRQFGEERLGVFQIGGVEALGKPAIERGEQRVRFAAAALFTPQPGEAGGCAQFQRFRLLGLGDADRIAAAMRVGLRALNQVSKTLYS